MQLSAYGLNGSIATELALLTQLTALAFWVQNLTGTLPSQLAMLTLLNELSFSKNLLIGTVPSEWGVGLSHLSSLYLYGNRLTGDLPLFEAPLSGTCWLELPNTYTSYDCDGVYGW
jgi:hypothetical protein